MFLGGLIGQSCKLIDSTRVCLNRMEDKDSNQERDTGGERVALGLAAGWLLVRHRSCRRNLLFVSTLLTLVMVFLGSAPLTGALGKSPFWFSIYWVACFFLVGFVLLLAIYDLIMIRKEHRERMKQLEQELSKAAEEARQLAEETKNS